MVAVCLSRSHQDQRAKYIITILKIKIDYQRHDLSSCSETIFDDQAFDARKAIGVRRDDEPERQRVSPALGFGERWHDRTGTRSRSGVERQDRNSV